MARLYPITQIVASPSAGVPARIRLSDLYGDVTDIFKGRFYRNAEGLILEPYNGPETGYTLIQATSFEIFDNPTFAGRYTVYTPLSADDPYRSAIFGAGSTDILINETINSTVTSNALDTGYVANVSTYVLTIFDESDLILSPTITKDDRSIALSGKFSAPWGESYNQNLIDLAQNFASYDEPTLPFFGQTWYDSSNREFKIFTGRTEANSYGWEKINLGSIASTRITQNTPTNIWEISHGLNLSEPYVCLIQIFVKIDGVYKMMIPLDIRFNSPYDLTVEFTSPQEGLVLIKP